jgi:hypothetical protein
MTRLAWILALAALVACERDSRRHRQTRPPRLRPRRRAPPRRRRSRPTAPRSPARAKAVFGTLPARRPTPRIEHPMRRSTLGRMLYYDTRLLEEPGDLVQQLSQAGRIRRRRRARPRPVTRASAARAIRPPSKRRAPVRAVLGRARRRRRGSGEGSGAQPGRDGMPSEAYVLQVATISDPGLCSPLLRRRVPRGQEADTTTTDFGRAQRRSGLLGGGVLSNCTP